MLHSAGGVIQSTCVWPQSEALHGSRHLRQQLKALSESALRAQEGSCKASSELGSEFTSEFASLLPHSVSYQQVKGPTQIQEEYMSTRRCGSLGQEYIFGNWLLQK